MVCKAEKSGCRECLYMSKSRYFLKFAEEHAPMDYVADTMGSEVIVDQPASGVLDAADLYRPMLFGVCRGDPPLFLLNALPFGCLCLEPGI